MTDPTHALFTGPDGRTSIDKVCVCGHRRSSHSATGFCEVTFPPVDLSDPDYACTCAVFEADPDITDKEGTA